MINNPSVLNIDPNLKSWIPYSEDSDFPIQNLPLGVFSRNQDPKNYARSLEIK